MINIWPTIIGGALSLFGVFIGAWLAATSRGRQQQYQNRVKSVLELYSEFQSESMLKSRIQASSALEVNFQDLSLGFSSLKTHLTDSGWFHVSKVIHFFEKYAVYYNARFLDDTLSRQTLERYFFYWYSKYLEPLARVSLEKESDEWGYWAMSIKRMGDKLRT